MKSFKKYLTPEKKQLKTEERLPLTDEKVLSSLKEKNLKAFSDYHDIHNEEVVRSESNDRKIIDVLVDLISENKQEFLGPKGTPGTSGVDGLPGAPGIDGRGINKTFIVDGNLLIKYDDGEQKLIGEVVGPQGIKGDLGLSGDKGDKGDTGEIGPQGIQGIKGDKGDKGDIGPQGFKGDIGPQGMNFGIRGDTGPQGEKGITGETGPQGIAGYTGDKGDVGPKGEIGPTGSIGKTGPQGIQGVIGTQGVKGETGSKGDKGDIGPEGPQGEKGDKGDIPDLSPIEEKFQKLSVDINKRVDRAVSSISTTSLNSGGGSGSYSLNDLSDTDHSSIVNATNQQVLTYNDSTHKWIAADATGGVAGADSFARITANAAFDKANSANVIGQSGWTTANSATILAQAGYDKANSANVLAQAAYDTANTGGAGTDSYARITANAAFDKANSANVLAQAAYDTANTGGAGIDSFARTTANAAFDKANSANVIGQSGWTTANSATILAQSGYDKANSANVLAQDAYNTANTKFSSSGGTISGNISISGNVSPVTDNIYSLGTSSLRWKDIFVGPGSVNIDGIILGNTGGKLVITGATDISIGGSGSLSATSAAAFDKANSANILAQAAYNTANAGGAGIDSFARTTANAAFDKANSANILAQAAYNTANAGGTATDSFARTTANAAFDKANTDFTNITTSAGVYGSATLVPVITLSSNGRIVSITNTTITGGGSSPSYDYFPTDLNWGLVTGNIVSVFGENIVVLYDCRIDPITPQGYLLTKDFGLLS